MLFVDIVVLLASSSRDLLQALGQLAAEWEAARMRMRSSKSEAMVLSWKRMDFPLKAGSESQP